MSESTKSSTPLSKSEFKPQTTNSDSDESFASYSDDFLEITPSLKLKPRLSSTFKANNGDGNNIDTKPSKQLTWNDGNDFDPADICANISVWERWLVSKLKLEKESLYQKREQAKIDKKEREKKQEEERKRKLLAQERHEKWLEEKILKMKLQKARQSRENRIKKEIEAEKQADLERKSKSSFNNWLKKHDELEQEKKLKEKEAKEKEMKSKEEKKEQAEKQYQQWLRDNKDRFAALRNKGPPSPSYVNPVPWVGPGEDERRRHPELRPRPHTSRENRPPLARSQSLTMTRCSTPKPRSRGLETHTPLRTGKPPSPRPSATSCLTRVHTPLRFSGYRPNAENRPRTRVESPVARRSMSKSRPEAPRPLCGMQPLVRCRSRSTVR